MFQAPAAIATNVSRGTPKKTIATTATFDPGDEIIVLAGTYNCATSQESPPALAVKNSGRQARSIFIRQRYSGQSHRDRM